MELAGKIGCRLEVALFTESISHPSWCDFLKLILQNEGQIVRWLVFDPTAKATRARLVEEASSALRAIVPDIPIVVGTNAYFAELNRNRPQLIDFMQVCYSITPQVHAFDNRSLCETLEAQASTVDSAVHVFG